VQESSVALELPVESQAIKNPLQGGFDMVAEDGIEPPTRGFSIPCSTN
jgi:hypothetical protein